MTLFREKYRVESIRRWNWDYTGDGTYFVTICTKDRRPHFGRVTDEVMHLSEIGRFASEQWQLIPSHYRYVTLDDFIVMPDHLHGIVCLSGPKNTPRLITRGAPLRAPLRSPEAGSLSNVIRQYKAGVARWCNKRRMPFYWQSGFYDVIVIRDDLEDVRQYIRDNPKMWGKEPDDQHWRWVPRDRLVRSRPPK